jgi:hypothetical protein
VLVFKANGSREWSEPTELDIWFKIVASAFQVNSLAASLFSWEKYTAAFFGTQEAATTFGVAFMELACLFPDGSQPRNLFVFEMLTYALAPLVLILISAIVFAMTVAPKSFTDKKRSPANEIWKTVRVSFRAVGVVVFYLFQPFLTQQVANLLNCVQLGADDWYSGLRHSTVHNILPALPRV